MTDPVIAQRAPYPMKVEAGQTYRWCACGLSKAQPLCDGSHKTTDIKPIAYEAKKTGNVYFCGCKHAVNKPLCDGTHGKI